MSNEGIDPIACAGTVDKGRAPVGVAGSLLSSELDLEIRDLCRIRNEEFLDADRWAPFEDVACRLVANAELISLGRDSQARPPEAVERFTLAQQDGVADVVEGFRSPRGILAVRRGHRHDQIAQRV